MEIKSNKDSFFDEKKKIEELESNDDFKKIKSDIDKGYNFIDYFLVIGLEPEIYKNKWLYEQDYKEIKEKHKDDIKPKIISSFPHFEKSTTSFSESILNHCFPNGYQIIKSNMPLKPKVFSFILDNNFFNINYPQKYLSCLICYENITQYKRLYEISKLEEDSKTDKNSILNDDSIWNSIKEPDIYIPKCILVISLYPFFGEMEKIVTEIYNYTLNKVHFIEKVEIEPASNPNLKKRLSKKIVIPKEITETLSTKEVDLHEPVEKIIENLLIELPVPPRGGYSVNYFLNGEERIIKQNEMNKLPLVDVNLKRICIDFEAKDIITTYNYLFLEYRILFFSKKIEYLNSYIHGFLSLLFPFQYQYQIITILPKENFETLESITPFIAGINLPYDKKFFEKNDFCITDCIFIVDIDKKEYSIYNNSEENKIEEFPKNYRKNLEKKLHDLINKSLKEEKKLQTNFKKQKFKHSPSIILQNQNLNQSLTSNNNNDYNNISGNISRGSVILSPTFFKDIKDLDVETNIEDDNNESEELTEMLSNLNIDYEFNQEVNELFFNFNSVLLSDYNQYLNRDFYASNNSPSLEALFKVKDFLKKIPSNDKGFYNKFISETQIFGDFIYLRMIPKNTKEKIRILLFDEKINENSKNITNVFTETKEYEFVSKHNIQKPRLLTEKEINFYKNKKNQKILTKYGIIVNTAKDDENKIIFNYPIFPKLTNFLFLADNIGVYFPPENWTESMNLINEDLISKSHLGDVSIRLDDMKKYIYLCWMQMWALTFWYSEENEQNYWFQELLRIIEASSCYEMEIFNLLFEALNNYGQKEMVLKLYDILLKKHLNPSFQIHSVAMKIIEKNKDSGKTGGMNDNLKKLLSNAEKSTKFKKNNFSRRTFRSRYYPNIYTENIKFFAFDTCIFCQQIINLESISLNLKEMNRDLSWTNCPNCKETLLPKLTVQFGEEINRIGDMKENTSTFDTVVLFSPYILKNNYSSIFGKEIGVKLDVHDLMMKYPSIFWNSLWYFKLNGLEYDFMQPYYYRLKEIGYKDLISWVEIGKTNENEESDDDSDEEEKSKSFDMSKLKITSNRITIK